MSCKTPLFFVTFLTVPAYSVDYCKTFTADQLEVLFAKGTRVVRGKDWEWAFQDFFSPGVVDTELNMDSKGPGWLNVQWLSGMTGNYRMGHSGKCDLELLRTVDSCEELANLEGQLGSCSPNAVCTSLPTNPAQYNCTCDAAFTGDGYNCVPIDPDDAPDLASPKTRCMFEDDDKWCGWRPEPMRQSAWHRHNGPTPSDGTGPNHASSFSNVSGTYVYFEASGREHNEQGVLLSPYIPINHTDYCQVSVS